VFFRMTPAKVQSLLIDALHDLRCKSCKKSISSDDLGSAGVMRRNGSL
jgi:hypothetical protein